MGYTCLTGSELRGCPQRAALPHPTETRPPAKNEEGQEGRTQALSASDTFPSFFTSYSFICMGEGTHAHPAAMQLAQPNVQAVVPAGLDGLTSSVFPNRFLLVLRILHA